MRQEYQAEDGIPLTLQELINYINSKNKDPFFFVLNRRQFCDPLEVVKFDEMDEEESSKDFMLLLNPKLHENLTTDRFYLRKLHRYEMEAFCYEAELSDFYEASKYKTDYCFKNTALTDFTDYDAMD